MVTSNIRTVVHETGCNANFLYHKNGFAELEANEPCPPWHFEYGPCTCGAERR